jgi:rhamnose utilization protein RhaD (predicted bifunctional aldolase and dehydrogenase)
MREPASPDGVRTELVTLSRELGDPAADLVILGEGNTSADLGDGSFWVKASGASLAGVGPGDFVRADRQAVLDLVEDRSLDEHDQESLGTRLRAATAGSGDTGADGPRPSIETMLHALSLQLPGVSVVAHTHPTHVNTLLCSDRAGELVAGSLFPDQVVVCGAESLLVPYAEPGLPLGRAFRDGLRAHTQRHGQAPRLVYLGNHGIVALGDSTQQVQQITAMAVKAARVLAGALAVGAPAFLHPDTVRRLDTRADEKHRREVLARSSTQRQR